MESWSEYLRDRPVQVGVAVGGAIVLVTTLILVSSRRRKNRPPGPRPWPLLGNIPALMQSDYIYQKCIDWQETYGPVFSLRLGLFDYIVINRADWAREALMDKGLDFAGRPQSFTGEILCKNKDILMSPPNKSWATMRKIVSGAVRKYAVSVDMQKRCQDAINVAQAQFAKNGQEPQDFSKSITLMVYNVMCGMCFGKSFEIDDPYFISFMTLTEKIEHNGLAADFIPILKYIPTPTVSKLKRLMATYHKYMKDVMEEHQNTYDPENITDLCYHIIQTQKEIEDETSSYALTSEQLHFIIMDVFFGGTETTTVTLRWLVLHLAAYPDIQEKVWREVDDIIGSSRPVQIKDRPFLPYVEAFILETMRMRPAAPMGVPRSVTQDTTLGGYDIPKGTCVLLNIFALHHDPQEWEDPGTFQPERFITPEGALITWPNSYGPFVFGRRNCVGEILAKADLHLMFALLVQRFQFLPAPETDVDLTPMTGGFQMFPRDGVKLVIKERPVKF